MAKDKVSLSGNKGEWSEPYVLLKLLADGKLFTADENLKKIENKYFPVLKVFRDKAVYEVGNKIQIFVNDELVKEVEQAEFMKQSKFLFDKISSSSKGSKLSFNETENFLKEICCEKLKASSHDKTDITMQIQDNKANDPVCGFSIKSALGGLPTLVNATGATNFVYEVVGLTDKQVAEINAIKTKTKIIDRLKKIYELSSSVSFAGLHKSFAENLEFIDSRMVELLSYAVLYHYRDKLNTCAEVVRKLASENPLKFSNTELYSYKFKDFLCATALGMTPATKWKGIDDANGGYIIVTKTGDVVAYHIFNRDSFKEYLLKNTKFEHASTSRHGYASLYKENGKLFIKLNMQIRFV